MPRRAASWSRWRLSPDAIAEHLSADVDLATVNDPGSCVVAGTDEAIRAFQADRLAEQGIVARRVRTSHAFHSRLMDSGDSGVHRLPVPADAPRAAIPLLSNVTGTSMSGREATNPATGHARSGRTVRFADELDLLLADPHRVLIEVGPGGTLTRRRGATRGGRATPRGPADAPPRPEPQTTTTRSCWRSVNCGRRASMSTGLR